MSIGRSIRKYLEDDSRYECGDAPPIRLKTIKRNTRVSRKKVRDAIKKVYDIQATTEHCR